MNIVVFGATGQSGRRIVRYALDEGHTVTAIARTPVDLEMSHDCLAIDRGDVTKYESFADSLQGQDAVISAIGGGGLLRRVTLYSEGIKNTITAMNAHDVSRLIGITAGGTHPGRDPINSVVFEWIVKGVLLRRVYTDMRRMEQIIENSELDWTIVRPSGLSNDPGDGSYQTEVGYSIPEKETTTRDDLAAFIVDEIYANEYIRKGVAVVTM